MRTARRFLSALALLVAGLATAQPAAPEILPRRAGGGAGPTNVFSMDNEGTSCGASCTGSGDIIDTNSAFASTGASTGAPDHCTTPGPSGCPLEGSDSVHSSNGTAASLEFDNEFTTPLTADGATCDIMISVASVGSGGNPNIFTPTDDGVRPTNCNLYFTGTSKFKAECGSPDGAQISFSTDTLYYARVVYDWTAGDQTWTFGTDAFGGTTGGGTSTCTCNSGSGISITEIDGIDLQFPSNKPWMYDDVDCYDSTP